MNVKTKKLYEKFHEKTSTHNSIISNNNFTYKIIIPMLNKYIKSNEKILDIGCGSGTLCLYLASKKNNVLGVDISSNAINAANNSRKKLKLKNIKFKTMNFPDRIPNDKYSRVICSEVLEHIKDDILGLKQIYKLLTTKGIVIITVPSINAPMFKLGLATDFDKNVGHLRRYNINKLQSIIKKTGFVILETKKTEGLLRNFLFLNPIGGKFIKFIKYFMVDIFTTLDNISLKILGESQIIIVARKP